MYKSCLIASKFLGNVGGFLEKEVILLVNGAELMKVSSRDKGGILRHFLLELLFREELVFKAFRDFAIAESR